MGRSTKHAFDVLKEKLTKAPILALPNCTALEVGSDDVASCYSIGVLTRRQVGRREGSRGARVVASCQVGVFRSPAY